MSHLPSSQVIDDSKKTLRRKKLVGKHGSRRAIVGFFAFGRTARAWPTGKGLASRLAHAKEVPRHVIEDRRGKANGIDAA